MTDEHPDLPAHDVQRRPSFWHWIVEGLRASVLLAPRIAASPSPWQLMLIVLIPLLLVLGIERLQVDGPATFHPAAELNAWWATALTLWVGWAALSPAASVSRWFALSTWAAVPWNLLMAGFALAYFRGWLPQPLTTTSGFWAVYGSLIACWLLSSICLMARCTPSRMRLALFVPGMLAITAIGIWQDTQQDRERVWQQDYSASAAPERPRLQLTQETFEEQQAVWQRAVAGLAPRPDGESHVYGLVFAPYASEDVFLRESAMVATLLEERFDAKGRVLRLVNHATTTQELPWATPLNLRRAVEALAARMDRERDVLVLYMTSHGARDFKLAATHWPLTVPWLTPQEVREALDAAGIRHRVIAISACYSGGWIEPLATEDSLIMTAADAEHTSYGCGRLSELTFFGRAVFNEELRKSHSFEAAFAAGVPVIRQREIDAGKDDGFSNPQIQVGEGIRPVLERLAKRLDSN
ncbi:Peptidase C13 family protein [Variovorax sp. CF079]|uniref:C13 family peptidase n=1 Tax=Variovorax sp. CF079 TaxID=1882774 RepID=UPI0008809237|nr:C13 family peptidase [Variovorax sp. CF079]SDD18048.1 Peptidase C13 family protein [Variovorax sp. CF079]